MRKTLQKGALAALPIVVIAIAACGGSSGTKTTTPPTAPVSTAAAPTEDAGALATRGANSSAAKLGPTVLNAADFPPDMSVLQQRAQIIQAGDLPGLISESSAFSATISTGSGDEFVKLIVVVLIDDAAASTALDAVTPENFLPLLAAGAPDLTTSPLDVANAPPGSKGFSYSGTGAKSGSGETRRRCRFAGG